MKAALLVALSFPLLALGQSYPCQDLTQVDFGDCGTPLGYEAEVESGP